MPPTRRATLASVALLGLHPHAARAERAPGELVFGLSTFPPTLQPWVSAGQSAHTVKLLIYRGLLSYDSAGALRGELAQSWSRDSDTGWRFVLRAARFSNGAPVTSADVKWTIEQVAAPTSTAYFRSEFQGVERIETPDDRTVLIVMKQPVVTLPLWLASPHMPVIAKDSPPSAPIGVGPFVIASQERGVAIELAASTAFYRPNLPKLGRVRMVAYADESLRSAALQSGDVDIVEYLPWQSFDAVAANPRLTLLSTVGPFMNLLFNGRTGPFKDARVRLATALAVRREEIVKSVFFGRGETLEGIPIPPDSPWYDPSRARAWQYDPARAKALLAEAGMGSGFDCTLLSTAQYGMHRDTAQIVQQHLAEIGINAKLSLPEWGQRVALGNRGQYEFAVFGTGADNNDPDGLAPLIDSELPAFYGRSFGVPTPELHRLFAQGRVEGNDSRRHAIYREATEVYLATAPMTTLAWRAQAYGLSRRVSGFRILPGALNTFSGSTLEETSVA